MRLVRESRRIFTARLLRLQVGQGTRPHRVNPCHHQGPIDLVNWLPDRRERTLKWNLGYVHCLLQDVGTGAVLQWPRKCTKV